MDRVCGIWNKFPLTCFAGEIVNDGIYEVVDVSWLLLGNICGDFKTILFICEELQYMLFVQIF